MQEVESQEDQDKYGSGKVLLSFIENKYEEEVQNEHELEEQEGQD